MQDMDKVIEYAGIRKSLEVTSSGAHSNTMLAQSEGFLQPLTQTSWGRFDARYLFWRGVLSLKFLASMNGVRAVCRSLNVATPEDQPVETIMTWAFSLGWNMDMTQQFVMWAAFLFVLTHFQFQTVPSCPLLAFAVTVRQRFVQNMCLSLP